MCEEKEKQKTDTERQTDKYIQKRARARKFRSRETDGHSRFIIQVRRRKIETEKKKSMPMRGTTKGDMRRELLLYSLWTRGQRSGADRETCERGGGGRASSPKRSKRKQQQQQQQQRQQQQDTEE
jgi:hypothetical protein